MSGGKHTPGPWQVRADWNGKPKLDSRDGYTVERADPTDGKPFVISTWSLPNARLIAEAPGMLAAFERILASDGMRPGHVEYLSRAEIAAIARDAIAKATGQ